MNKILINLSNHPYNGWSDSQKKEAAKYGTCVDMQFPNVSAMATAEEVDELAKEYLDKVITKVLHDFQEVTVHVMGEQTFCYKFIKLCEKQNELFSRSNVKARIRCIASSTERDVEILPDGAKRSVFKFGTFRNYFS